MSVLKMAWFEILRRKRSFLLATLAVVIAVGSTLVVYGALKVYDLRAAQVLAEKEKSLNRRLKQLEDEMRKATLKLSFNLAILPAKQNLREWHDQDFASATMPEDYVQRMARSKILSVRHFLPTLTQKCKWPERNRTIILVGTRGEVPNLMKGPRKPLVQPVADGTMVVGYELQQSLGLKVGQKVKLMGREFVISKCHAERGSKDDIGVWIPLKDAQDLLKMPGRINSILALECVCVGNSAIDQIRAEVAKFLPDTQVVELGTHVVARGEARAKVKQEAITSMQREKEAAQQLQSERVRLGTMVIPVVVIACGLWIFLVALVNTRKRRSEVAILRALGYRATQVLVLLLFRSFAGGVIGAAVGCAVGLVIAGQLRGDLNVPLVGADGMLSWQLVAATLLIGSLLGVVAGWMPALIASQQDPASILKDA